MLLLVRNQVENFEAWLAVYRSDAAAREAAGLHGLSLWRSADDPNDLFFLMHVDDRGRAEAFMRTSEAAARGVEAGMVGGEYWFVESVE